MSVHEAALAAGKRRMRPIFLTSAAACSVGVIPMILSRSTLWGPLGTVICFGLLISMVLTLFLSSVLYTIIYRDKTKAKTPRKHIPYTNILKTPIIIIFIAIGITFSSKSYAQERLLSIDSCKILLLCKITER